MHDFTIVSWHFLNSRCGKTSGLILCGEQLKTTLKGALGAVYIEMHPKQLTNLVSTGTVLAKVTENSETTHSHMKSLKQVMFPVEQ